MEKATENLFAVSSRLAGDATDSICPKGWEMARYNGDGSYNYLMNLVYSKYPTGNLNRVECDSGLKYFPLSFSRTGDYDYRNENTDNRTRSYGLYWESRVRSATHAQSLRFHSTNFDPQNYYSKGFGFSVRCVAKRGDATDSICPKGWEMARNNGNNSIQNLLSFYTMYEAKYNDVGLGLLRKPLSYNNSGIFYWNTGNYTGIRSVSLFWLSAFYSLNNSYRVDFGSSYISFSSLLKGYGLSVRWGANVAKINII